MKRLTSIIFTIALASCSSESNTKLADRDNQTIQDVPTSPCQNTAVRRALVEVVGLDDLLPNDNLLATSFKVSKVAFLQDLDPQVYDARLLHHAVEIAVSHPELESFVTFLVASSLSEERCTIASIREADISEADTFFREDIESGASETFTQGKDKDDKQGVSGH